MYVFRCGATTTCDGMSEDRQHGLVNRHRLDGHKAASPGDQVADMEGESKRSAEYR